MAPSDPTLVTLQTADHLVLHGELTVPEDAWAMAVLTHPHPRYGGDMDNVVPSSLARALPAAGVGVVRFDFRGVRASEGDHDDGYGERFDVVAAIDALAPFAERSRAHVPLVVAGYSFGADVALCVADPRLSGWVAIAPPLATVPVADMIAAHDHRPKLVLAPEHDQFDPPERAAQRTAGWTSVEVRTVTMADHFLAGRVAAVVDETLAFLRSLV